MEGFVRYVSEPDLHDGRVVSANHEGPTVRVVAATYTEQRVSLVFNDVRTVKAVRPEGMELYAIAEAEASPPFRRFVFVNWDEEEDPRRLEMTARSFEWQTL